MAKNIYLSLLMTILSMWICNALAVPAPHVNATSIKPPQDGHPVIRTYVLATGTIDGGADWENVNVGTISKAGCQTGYAPDVISSPVHSDVPHKSGWVNCDPHMRNINAQAGLVKNQTGGYDLLVSSGVQTDSGCESAPVKLNYVVYCEPINRA